MITTGGQGLILIITSPISSATAAASATTSLTALNPVAPAAQRNLSWVKGVARIIYPEALDFHHPCRYAISESKEMESRCGCRPCIDINWSKEGVSMLKLPPPLPLTWRSKSRRPETNYFFKLTSALTKKLLSALYLIVVEYLEGRSYGLKFQLFLSLHIAGLLLA